MFATFLIFNTIIFISDVILMFLFINKHGDIIVKHIDLEDKKSSYLSILTLIIPIYNIIFFIECGELLLLSSDEFEKALIESISQEEKKS